MTSGCFLLANWGCSLHLAIQTTCSFSQGHFASLHYIPIIQSNLSGAAQQTLVNNGNSLSSTRFHELVQKLKKAERWFLSKQYQVDFWDIKHTIKNFQEEEETEDYYLSALFLSTRVKQVQNFEGFYFWMEVTMLRYQWHSETTVKPY